MFCGAFKLSVKRTRTAPQRSRAPNKGPLKVAMMECSADPLYILCDSLKFREVFKRTLD
jgi:hypothetical protein